MMSRDLRSVPEGIEIHADIAIIGDGAAGIASAGQDCEAEIQALNPEGRAWADRQTGAAER